MFGMFSGGIEVKNLVENELNITNLAECLVCGVIFFFLSNNFHILQTSATNKIKVKIQYKI